MTDCEFLVEVLKDGEAHCLNEILQLSFRMRGCGLTVHSRAADLRKLGFDVRNWKDGERGNGSWYRLVPLDEESRLDSPRVSDLPQIGTTLLPSSSGPWPGGGEEAAQQPDGQLVLVGEQFRRRAS